MSLLRTTTLGLVLAFAQLACGEPSASDGAGGGGAQGGGGTTQSSSSSSSASAGGDGAGGDGAGGDGAGGDGAGGTGAGGAGAGGAGGGGAGGAGAGGAGGGAVDYYGAISGACGEIDDTDLLDDLPQLLANALDFTGERPFSVGALTGGGQAMYAAGNLGGSSIYSEIFAFEVLHRCDGAELLKTEGEIIYDTEGKKTDILVDIAGERVGVSVVRAMSFPEGAPYSFTQAKNLLQGKLSDVLLSSANVAPVDAWPKQILSVIAQTDEHADTIALAWADIDDAIRADTIVVVTVTHGVDGFVYYNQ